MSCGMNGMEAAWKLRWCTYFGDEMAAVAALYAVVAVDALSHTSIKRIGRREVGETSVEGRNDVARTHTRNANAICALRPNGHAP